MKKYLSKNRYKQMKVEGGRKAYIPEIVTITIQRIFETIGYKGTGGRIYVEIAYGFDGAGYNYSICLHFSAVCLQFNFFSSYTQFNGASVTVNMRNMIHGGVRIFRILDEEENEIFVEKSQDYDTVRPHFLITGKFFQKSEFL